MPNSAHEGALIDAVTKKLRGEFYVGQKVKHKHSYTFGYVVSTGMGATVPNMKPVEGASVRWYDNAGRDIGVFFYPSDALEPVL